MMTKPASPGLFHAALQKAGYKRAVGGAYKDSSEVRAVCGAGVSRKNGLADVTIGFWIHQLPGIAPESYNHCHIYGGMESILPKFSNISVVAGQANEDSWQELIGISDDIAKEIESLLNIKALRQAFDEGRFAKCLIRKEARVFLQG